MLKRSAAEAATCKSAAHLWCVLALSEKVRMNSVSIPINLFRCLRICRRPPRFADGFTTRLTACDL